MNDHERRHENERIRLSSELFALESRLALLTAYAEHALEAEHPHRGLALYLADELARVKSLARRMFELS